MRMVWDGSAAGTGEADQPQVTAASGGLAEGGDAHQGGVGGIGFELGRHAGIGGDVRLCGGPEA